MSAEESCFLPCKGGQQDVGMALVSLAERGGDKRREWADHQHQVHVLHEPERCIIHARA